MRWVIAVCAFALLGCDDDELLYADGSDWEPVVPVKGPSSIPKDLREWDRYFSQSGIQADKLVKTFAPTWTGFSADPVEEISYLDFGELVVLWNDTGASILGTSDSAVLEFTGLPVEIRPESGLTAPTSVVDSGTFWAGEIHVNPSGNVNFSRDEVSGAYISRGNGVSFTAAGLKGLPPGWLIMYAK
jgi:hypothetical protein